MRTKSVLKSRAFAGISGVAALCLIGAGTGLKAIPTAFAPGEPVTKRCLTPRAIDGDTIKCGRTSIRLLGIDAPELAGHCRKGRVCAPGDPRASTAGLVAALKSGRVTVQVFGTDIYQRHLGIVRANAGNLSCLQLESGHAVYKPNWDRQRRIARECLAGRRT